MYFCNSLCCYQHYIDLVRTQYPNCIILVEEFLKGPQYIVEAVAINKKIVIEAIRKQEIEFINNHFIITGYSLGFDYENKFYLKLKNTVEDILEQHELENGPCHLEMRLVNDEWKLIEINPRISCAGMNQLIEIGLGYSLVEEHLKFALNQKTNFIPRHQKNTFSEYVILNKRGILQRITGREQVLKCEGVKCVYVKPKKGTVLTPPISLGNRYAFVIATGDCK